MVYFGPLVLDRHGLRPYDDVIASEAWQSRIVHVEAIRDADSRRQKDLPLV
jgi:hypothetical protein